MSSAICFNLDQFEIKFCCLVVGKTRLNSKHLADDKLNALKQ